ncbi:hypothetical protein GR925_37440 [Streptomyces sp. HUCO-GS316]|uniref:hypothetical protein n=1 Tax=Streptomyces sp. HUCO-GS316 TaxID=2692198 RepID=UPI001370C525|nr:hypothetical protein [Streptomyces sp. HUCO-GS316]MXM68932.1 hypothetical protein [Streptomyces sp. HUCO-GS316]
MRGSLYIRIGGHVADTWLLVGFAAIGGSLSGLLDLIKQITAWKEARRLHLSRSRHGRPRPPFNHYWDPAPELVSMAAHMLLGAGLGSLLAFSNQINDSWAACLVGASAPTLITRVIGSSRVVQQYIMEGVPDASPVTTVTDASTPHQQNDQHRAGSYTTGLDATVAGDSRGGANSGL